MIKTANMTYIEHDPLQKPIHNPRDLRIICIGAGVSGLCFAYKLQRSFENFELIIYEKNAQVSGTWFENTYPGCRCDFPSVNYVYTFEPKTDYSTVYATSAEIRQYFEDFKTRHGLDRYCKLQHKVVGAHWLQEKRRWSVEVEDLSSGRLVRDSCDILINACGYLNAWRWPSIRGLANFQGSLLHSANWNHDISLAGKSVGLIGNGASAIQILPSIQPLVKNLTTFIRSPTWISPPFGDEQRIYSESELDEFKNKPGALLRLRKENENRINGLLDFIFAGSALQAGMRSVLFNQMRDKLNMPELEELLIPPWAVGCRRLTPGPNYLECLRAPNVEVAFGECEMITEEGVVVNGREYVLDILICATGFDNSYRPQFPVIGLDEINLQDQWASEAKGYMGIAASGFPNYLMFTGPNSPVGNGTVIPAIEAQADYMLKLCNRWQVENISSFHPTKEAVEDFTAHTDQFMKNTVWDQDCQSWFKKHSVTARNTALWPGSTLHYLEAMSAVRYNDWNINYRGNRFSWLGNGYSQTELLPDGDLSYYIRDIDDSPFLGNAKRIRALTTKRDRDIADFSDLVNGETPTAEVA